MTQIPSVAILDRRSRADAGYPSACVRLEVPQQLPSRAAKHRLLTSGSDADLDRYSGVRGHRPINLGNPPMHVSRVLAEVIAPWGLGELETGFLTAYQCTS